MNARPGTWPASPGAAGRPAGALAALGVDLAHPLDRVWRELADRFAWARALDACAQDATHHPEGDVGTHTRLVLEALVAAPGFAALSPATQDVLGAAAILHDVAKPETTREEGGRLTSPGHARAGALLARRILWTLGVDVATREAVAGLVRWHMRPNFLLEAADPRKELFRVSMTARWDQLVRLAAADAAGRGRPVPDAQRELLALLGEYAAEERCLTHPREFPNDRSRVLYFAKADRDPDYAAHDDTWGEVLLVCGLPGVGKNTWLARLHPTLPQVSRDDVRLALGLRSGEDEARVTHAVMEEATLHLRQRRPFAFNATHLVRDLRAPAIALAHRYGARVRAVVLEADAATQRTWNASRPEAQVVPEHALDRILSRWDVPDLTEVERLDVFVHDAPSVGRPTRR